MNSYFSSFKRLANRSIRRKLSSSTKLAHKPTASKAAPQAAVRTLSGESGSTNTDSMANKPASTVSTLKPWREAQLLSVVMWLLVLAGVLLLINSFMPCNKSIPAVASAVMLLCHSLIFWTLRQMRRR